jgi:hypothetical protein
MSPEKRARAGFQDRVNSWRSRWTDHLDAVGRASEIVD